MTKVRQYIDFKLFLSEVSITEETYQVSLLPTPELGETILPIPFSTSEGAYKSFAAALAVKGITLRILVKVGKQLADWLLPQPIRELFMQALKEAGNEGGVRLRLLIADHSLKQIPWEYIYFDPLDPNGEADSPRGFLALDPRVSIVRHEPLPLPHPRSVEATGSLTTLRMVVATASPADKRRLAVETEVDNLKKALDGVEATNVDVVLTKADILSKATLSEIKAALIGDEKTRIFHFAGHGVTETVDNPTARGEIEAGFLYLIGDKETKQSEKVAADLLAKILATAGVWLVTLGACQTGQRSEKHPWHSVAGALVAHQIPAVVAMQYEVKDGEAIIFSEAFYQCLESGLTLDEAMSWSRIKMAGTLVEELDTLANVEWGVPVLYSRLADGVLVPELVEYGSDAAEAFRQEIQDKVDNIIQIQSSLEVDVVEGEATNIDLDEVKGGESNIEIVANTKVKEVKKEGKVIGVKIKSLG